jgi:hypothetical protein
MRRYFFDVIADGEFLSDDEGMLLPNIDAARREASQSLSELAREEIGSKRASPNLTISVRTDEGPVYEAALQWSLKSLQ